MDSKSGKSWLFGLGRGFAGHAWVFGLGMDAKNWGAEPTGGIFACSREAKWKFRLKGIRYDGESRSLNWRGC
jgi:hypothetical protein